MTPELQGRVINRLVETEAANQSWALAILAALEGAAALDAYLSDTATVPLPASLSQATAPAKALPEPPGVYVSSMTVEGFRGVGKVPRFRYHRDPG